MRLRAEDIGGGRVARAFSVSGASGSERIRYGTVLSREFLLAIPRANLITLIDKHFIDVWPVAAAVSPPVEVVGRTAERHVVSLGFGRYTVIEGTKLTEDVLTEDDAYLLAGKEKPKKKA